VVDRFAEGDRGLHPIDLSDVPTDDIARTVGQIADPERPIATPEFVGDMFGAAQNKQPISRFAKLAAAGLVVLGLVALWRYTPLSDFTDPDAMKAILQSLGSGWWMPLVVIAVFVVSSLVVFPVTVLIVMTGMMYGPLPAFAYALTGALLASVLNYAIGYRVGAQPLRNLLGTRVNRVTRSLAKRGVLSVAALRMLPVAPFTFVNLAAGAGQVKFFDFLAGTVLGMAPGILVITLLGNQLGRVLTDPKPMELVMFGLFILAWLATSLGLQALASRLRTSHA